MKHLIAFGGVVASLLLLANTASAERLSPEEALAGLNRQTRKSITSNSHLNISQPRDFQLVRTIKANAEPAAYLFAEPTGGFVLLAADDSSQPVLGYSDSALPANEADYPPAFVYWMNSLAKQVEYNATHGLHVSAQKIIGAPIEPLTLTRWNQDLPFNYYCPIADNKHCYTGCVATALAQIMKYHSYPPKGTGSHSYGWKNPTTEKDTTLSFDYANTEFKWDLMQDTYNRDTPWDDKMEVAKLMYACGVAVNMGYGPWSSGAGTSVIGPAMINYFGYDKGIRNYIRDYYGIDEWNEIVYNQLKDYGPVQYSGFGDTDGHSFIIDGYNDAGYFHVNWGWGGMSDGYFLLTALDPLEQGIGGAEQAFDFSQDFIGNVSTEQKTEKIYEQILLDNAFGLEQTSAKPGDTLHIWGGSFNYSVGPIPKIMFGAMLIPVEGSDTLYLTGPQFTDLGIGDGVRPYDVKLPDAVPAGTYKLVPAFRNSDDVWRQIPVKVGFTDSYTTVSNGSTITFTKGSEATLTADDVHAPVNVVLKEKFEVTATLKNGSDEEFFGSICVALFNPAEPETVMVKSDAVPVDVLAGESQDFAYEALFDPDDSTLKSGAYDLYICRQLNGKLTKISDPVEVELGDDISTAIIEVSDKGSGIYYNLFGMKMSGVPIIPGIYVLPNGKKILVRGFDTELHD